MRRAVMTTALVAGIAAPVAMAELDSDQVRAVVADMLADAQSRSSLLQGGGSAGWDDGFFIESGDGAFRLNVGGQLQFQFVGNSNDSTVDDYDHDFVNRRTKLEFDGTVHDDWGFRLTGGFDRMGGTFVLEDAFVTNQINDDVKVTFGQFKSPFLAEELNSSKRLLGAERSYTNEWFTLGRTQGIMFSGGSDTFRWMASFNDGSGVTSFGTNTEFSNSGLYTMNTDWSLTGRVEFLFGDDAEWSQFDDMSAASGSSFAGRIGGALNYQQASDIGGADEQTSLSYTVDAWFEWDAASLQAWFIGQSTEDEGGVTGVDNDQFAFGVQGGIHLVPDEWELFGRWEYLDFDNAFAAPRDDSLNLFTVGVTNYIHGNAVKWTNQITFAFDEVPAGSTSTALVTDAPGQDGQFGFISQIQLLF